LATNEPPRAGPSPKDPPLAARPAPAPAPARAPRAEALGAPRVQRAPRDAAQKQLAARWAAESHEQARESVGGDGRTSQASFLAVLTVRDGHEGALRAILDTIEAEDCETNHVVPFLRLHTVHFARFVLYDARLRRHVTQDANAPGLLLFATDHDGGLDAHLDELVGVAAVGLASIFEHCEGAPPPGAGPEALKRHLVANQRRSNTFYSGTRRRSVLQIRREKLLRECIEDFLDREREGEVLRAGDPLKIREAIQAHVFTALPWAREVPGPYPKAVALGLLAAGAGLAVLAVLAAVWALLGTAVTLGLVGAVVAILFGAGLYLRRLEVNDPEARSDDNLKEHTDELAANEDHIVQNQMTSVRRIKVGRFRLTLLRLVLYFIDKVARWVQVTGTLAGIPSIHFARWVILDEGRTLVFFSNFDGSWENYLGDFIDKAAEGLTAVWSNCIGFPATQWLVGGGARAEWKFKDYTRDSQIVTNVWYSAYKTLTVANTNDNSFIRLGLYGAMNAEEARRWLRRL
jgi:hypothetical protein